MNILELWKKKHAAGQIRFDPDISIVGPPNESGWGTVYYSPIRELYKSEVKSRRSTSFDLELMERMNLFDHGGLRIAANPNSLFEGHLVVYPKTKSSELTRLDVIEISELAEANPNFAFIHNAERSAASIVDWAHFQAYAMTFPVAEAAVSLLAESNGMTASTIASEFPAYAIRLEGSSVTQRADVLFRIAEILKPDQNPRGQRIPLNFIWIGEQAWVIPRARNQSERAARYFGGLEMGGIFCLPNRADESSYRTEALREEVIQATLRTETEHETARWFEQVVREVVMGEHEGRE